MHFQNDWGVKKKSIFIVGGVEEQGALLLIRRGFTNFADFCQKSKWSWRQGDDFSLKKRSGSWLDSKSIRLDCRRPTRKSGNMWQTWEKKTWVRMGWWKNQKYAVVLKVAKKL